MNIYVGNLSYQVTEDDLREAFAAYGDISNVNIIRDRDTGQSKGFGFVEMSDNGQAEEAIQKLNESNLKGRNMKVNEARPREEKPKRNFRPRH
ncbi:MULTISPECIES: RNA recognition motif domain-containing protein [Hahella]|uniref:RNA-binding protein (RRM domain) n=1 Tax=Hahella chejuensis (strain KCTC 2396) TaxID=349521 RepID=Q2SPS0_HAHCH|nr:MULTISPECIES: RNA-binding protein [Hahella]ABC27354.1 RNA-binding protein (RRM domain) [Hahella chejuensis KCTC 2396]AZZ89989.1 RNA-binding protein [Hahella sp. KA22]MBU6954259.1 RNA-binding protein [Hahella sp. HN01]MDG9666117.1 RNA-binding protein [Hahella sp. CR1]QAY53357.1 RNA-binding protein [Hahella sp. KA22]